MITLPTHETGLGETDFGIGEITILEDGIRFTWTGENHCTVNGVQYQGSAFVNLQGDIGHCSLNRWDGRKFHNPTDAAWRKLRAKLPVVAEEVRESHKDFLQDLPRRKTINEIEKTREEIREEEKKLTAKKMYLERLVIELEEINRKD